MKLKTLDDIEKRLLINYTDETIHFVKPWLSLIRKEAIEWIKKDMKDSVDGFLYMKEGKEFIRKDSPTLPNGKYCQCDHDGTCKFHMGGVRLMKFLNIREKDVITKG